jgi:timeless
MDRLFYGNEPLDRLPKLLSRWTPGTTTREYLCDLVELCHVSLKLLDSNAQNFVQVGENKKIAKQQIHDKVEKIKMVAAEFDFQTYFCRKIVSNQLVSMYTHLLGQYKANAANVNHRVMAMFLRFSRTVLASPEAQDAETPINPLGTRRVTLEPMLYNIQLILVMDQILNDTYVRNEKEYESLTTFCTNLMYKFWTAAQDNPMLYVECLFRHVAPHRFCESFTNMYVSEELRMIAERELLLEEQRRYEEAYMESAVQHGNHEEVDDDDEEELEFTGDGMKPVKGVPKLQSNSPDRRATNDMEEESEKGTACDGSDVELNEEDSNLELEKKDSDTQAAKQVKEKAGLSKRSRDSLTDSLSSGGQPEKRPRTKMTASDGVDSSDEEIDFGADADKSVPHSKSRFVIDDDDDN